MKITRILTLLMMGLTLALAAGVVQASMVTYTGTHNFTLTLAPNIAPDNGYVSAGVYGTAQFPAESFSANDYKTISIGTPVTATATAGAGAYLKTGTTSVYSDGNKGAFFSRTMVGEGPAPSGVTPGYIRQSNWDMDSQKWYLHFTVSADGDYSLSLTDNYSIGFNLDQGTGSLYPFYDLNRYSKLCISIQSSGGDLDDVSWLYNQSDSTPGSPLANINFTTTDISIFEQEFEMFAGDEINVCVWVEAQYDGKTLSPVPVPATVFLLGGALLGLAIVGRRQVG